MKKITIKIIVPKDTKKGKWRVSVKTGYKQFILPTSLFKYLEGKVSSSLASDPDAKIHLIVNSDQLHGLRLRKNPEWFNDITSNNKKELLYALTCFLEDFLTKKYASEKYKRYFGRGVI